MKRYLLDSSVLPSYLRGRPKAVALIQPWIDANEATTNIVVYGEVVEFFKSLDDFPRRLALLRQLMLQIRPQVMTYAILERYADLRRSMRPPYGPGLIGDIDTLIAATALVHQLTVVTLDGDFTRVPGLSVMRLTRDDLR